MNRITFLEKSKSSKSIGVLGAKNDLVRFVANQFKQLAKKNLRVPIQLYHL